MNIIENRTETIATSFTAFQQNIKCIGLSFPVCRFLFQTTVIEAGDLFISTDTTSAHLKMGRFPTNFSMAISDGLGYKITATLIKFRALVRAKTPTANTEHCRRMFHHAQYFLANGLIAPPTYDPPQIRLYIVDQCTENPLRCSFDKFYESIFWPHTMKFNIRYFY